ncbi:LuxR family transcriptional regulator [Ammonifex thiophilus]|uniref:Helix-turn-helix transcriptional regulator n=1 Tax=Ammonifex thiophilus TaxID=444093 RepID=A0A3D8P1Y2_9THEO|nr:LuxR C-terminal-related transcriptional regulator [Ammonifex thiophilus]RDV82046.1 helix-turn-helix transcriptional regulator [Ammonifex thiophilus]
MPFLRTASSGEEETYLCSHEELEASYARCRRLGVPPGAPSPRKILNPTELAPRLKANLSLVTLARHIVAPICHRKSYLYILCDPELVALEIFAAPEVLTAAERKGFMPGTIFTEESCGTNALSLAKELRRLVAIRGEQHYCRLFKYWWCVASPVKDPNGKISGYLDISLHAEKELGLAAAHLQTLVARIEDRLLLAELRTCQENDAAPAPLRIPPEVAARLTAREREVLKLMLEWLDDVEIARRLHISRSTVKTHRWNIYRKFGVRNLRELLAKLRR